MAKKIAVIDIDELDRELFAGLPEDIRRDIKRHPSAIIVTFCRDGVKLFGAAIELNPDHIYVREVVGKFPRFIRWLDEFCEGIGRGLNIRKIVFSTERPAVSKIGEKLGFHVNINGDYERVIYGQ